jgi:hypothetical protein
MQICFDRKTVRSLHQFILICSKNYEFGSPAEFQFNLEA